MDKGTIARTVGIFVVLVNQFLAIFDMSPLPFSSEEVELFVSTLITAVMALIAWFKDNDVTKAARERKGK